jgi:DNA-binding Lrp family transcriptional regulator
MPTSYERLDVKDRAIAEAIVQNPRASVPWISKATGYPESTVNKHLSAMQQLDRLVLGRIIQVLNWRAVGYPLRYRVDILVDQRMLSRGKGGPYGKPQKSKAERISTQEQLGTYIKYTLSKQYEGRIVVLDASILLGHAADLTVALCAKDSEAIRDFVTTGLRGLGGVNSTSTSEQIWTCPPLPELVGVADDEAPEIKMAPASRSRSR